MAQGEVWEFKVWHDQMNKFRVIRGSDKYIVEQKANAQLRAWEEAWEKKEKIAERKKAREAAIKTTKGKKKLAITKTYEAQEAISLIETVLHLTLTVNDAIDWSKLISKKKYPVKEPAKKQWTKTKPEKREYFKVPIEPLNTDKRFQPVFGFFDKLSSKSREKKHTETTLKFSKEHKAWEKKRQKSQLLNEKLDAGHLTDMKKWEAAKKKFQVKQSEVVKQWTLEKEKFEANQEKKNSKVLTLKVDYESNVPAAITDYCEMVLANSVYPDSFPQNWDIDFNADTKILIVDYSLPDLEALPKIKSVKYIISRDEFTETYLSSAALHKLYDALLYQIALRTIHELFEADVVNAIDSIVFNGWVESINKATGHNVNACIMSVQACKDEFLAINLAKIDPKACFKQLKGVGSSKLYGLSPVPPIISIDKVDRRFVSAYGVVDGIGESENLAAMDWQDFENLIREMFEKEFSRNGGEVKITQASRDGGVDAIAFDPDPIRGGKIVIQAKRYTNTVGVSAVRDLYGTTLNEGATKGILVTTSDYGPDAYSFAKGKPLTLLNGGNLLHLLEAHGHRAKIDLKEAKLLLAEAEKLR